METVGDWVPVALSGQVETASSTGVVVNGTELVVWRDNKGAAHIWEDRCPHRGMRMSFGFVRGDHLACLYHGWQYDTSGQCQHIPAHPDLEVPKTIRLRTYGVAERNGMIWAGLNETSDVAALAPAIDGLTPVRSLYIDVSAESLMAYLASARLPGDANTAALENLGPNLLALKGETTTVLLGVQPMAEHKLGLHIVTASGEPSTVAGLARWAQALRLAIETGLASEAA
mgnify:CR=1 FL=1